ncbi:hypothetical protein TTHERM_000143679 (macronuclear) [Tetrahymena thermophila SB210]|uniref:Uncharacterized protein n=1 Tax=Tetrahymena thermophila (strain SB210) TaxID=312017 RepID=W7XL45_TETTS|nr:hypothetical protein TTHERM_000143679 [Tetrahymena thermophila SB210]EWS75649.1 hypothetical protein TTHERM_000143679 [Tetrahymena thermophila SB210]|eukprot:XP_012651795.1 hypothetical protein TTHERM_000143679 [Tetrahymena thermophila SB210]
MQLEKNYSPEQHQIYLTISNATNDRNTFPLDLKLQTTELQEYQVNSFTRQ